MFRLQYGEVRPYTFSIYNVLCIPEVRSLITIAFFRQMNGTLCVELEIKGLYPPDEDTYEFYAGGGATSLIFIAIFSDLLYRKRKKWLPPTIWISITLAF